MQIAKDTVASFLYTLTNDKGEILDQSSEGNPLDYLHGASNIIPGLEAELLGKVAGDKLNVSVSPENAYGEFREDMIQVLPKSAFPEVQEVEVGMQFVAQGPDGQMVMLNVTKVEGDDVTVDGNHPLAGETLHFEVEICEVREATPSELQQGRVDTGCCGGHGGCCGGEEDGDHECCGGHDHDEEHECCGGNNHDDDHECCGGKGGDACCGG